MPARDGKDRRMKQKGVEPGDIRTVDDLKYLPFTDKPDLRDQFPYGLFAAPLRDMGADVTMV